jgi:hypothetical protein
MQINWPDKCKPENTAVHVKNELLMPGVELEGIWAWLCRPDLWPTWYKNCAYAYLKNQPHLDLRLGTEFCWKTFYVTIDSTVREFVPHERLAWDAHCNGVQAYHAWTFERRHSGVYVVTEETQNGWLARMAAFVVPNRMWKWHQRWLEALSEMAKKGLPGTNEPHPEPCNEHSSHPSSK